MYHTFFASYYLGSRVRSGYRVVFPATLPAPMLVVGSGSTDQNKKSRPLRRRSPIN